MLSSFDHILSGTWVLDDYYDLDEHLLLSFLSSIAEAKDLP
jgi:hypothetical protein